MTPASIAPAVALRRFDDRRPGGRAETPSTRPVTTAAPAAVPAPKPSGPMIYTVEKGANVLPWIDS